MKTKKFCLLVISLLLTSSLFAERTNLQERTDNWLQKSTAANSSGRGIIGPNTNPTTTEPAVGAVGDALWLLIGLGLAYSFINLKTKKSV